MLKKPYLFFIFFIGLFYFFSISCNKKASIENEKIEIKEIETNKIFITQDQKNLPKKINLLILPLKDKSNKKRFPASENIKNIIFNSLFDFISIVPSINIEEKETIYQLSKELKEINPEEIFNKYNTEIIIFGDYYLQKKENKKPEVIINFNIWNKATNNIIKTKYTSKKEIEIFEIVDNMLAKIIKTTFNEDLKISYLNFENFDINNGKYLLFINERIVSFITNSNFRLNLKILSGFEYHIKIKNIANQKIVLDKKINLKVGETATISHKATANIKCEITNNSQNEIFRIFLDNKELFLQTNYSIPAERILIFHVTNLTKNDHYTLKYYISDGEDKIFYLPKARKVIEKYGLKSQYGVGSMIKYYYSDQYTFFDKKSLVIDASISPSSWANIEIIFDNTEINWEKYNTIKLLIYGRKSHDSYAIQLVDKYNEIFFIIILDNWEDWKEISIPFEKIKSRLDYQFPTAKVNRKIDFPIKIFTFEISSLYPILNVGNAKIILNQIELTRE